MELIDLSHVIEDGMVTYPGLQAQHDDAAAKGQDHRAELFNELLTGLTKGEAS